jgi:putative endonuclease
MGFKRSQVQVLSPRLKIFKMYVYILKSGKDGSLYVGSTNNLEERISHHNRGYSLSTKSRIPWVLVRTETFNDVSVALRRERFLKSGRGREILKKQFG